MTKTQKYASLKNQSRAEQSRAEQSSLLLSLQVIRAIAFLDIFISHAALQAGIIIFPAGGTWGVSVFCILSGFLMMYRYANNETFLSYSWFDCLKFAVRKLKKLYPLHIVTMIIAIPFLIQSIKSPYEISDVIKSFVKIVFNVLLVHSWYPKSSVFFALNAVSWYLCLTIFFYFMFPIILQLMKKYRSVSTATGFVVAIYVLQVMLNVLANSITEKLGFSSELRAWVTYNFPVSRLEDFFIGCNLGYIFVKHHQKNQNQSLFTMLEIIAIVITLLDWVIHTYNSSAWWSSVVMHTPCACLLIYLFALNYGKISELMEVKPLIYLGNISAYTFLIHQLVIRYWGLLADKTAYSFSEIPFIVSMGTSLVITVILSEFWRRAVKAFSVKLMKD